MQRILESELMTDENQVKAYAEADFSQPHNHFIQLIQQHINDACLNYLALDLGCGSGDISCRFARAFPECHIVAIDGSKVMLKYANLTACDELKQRIDFVPARLPNATLPALTYNIIFSNSLLHHLSDAQILWSSIKKYGQRGTQVFIMDLFRPSSVAEAGSMVNIYASEEPEILQRDFYNSLLAAFSVDEINIQLENARLDLAVEQVSDRHVFIYGAL